MADPQTQSSFIPKRSSMAGAMSRSGGLFPFLANSIFVIALIASVAVFAYDKYLENQIGKMNTDLGAARAALEPDLIHQLVQADQGLNAAQQLVADHVTLSSFFELLQTLTLQNVRFTSFSYMPDESGAISITMKGEAATYAAVALQSQIFSSNDNFIDPQFSNLDLNDKGNVVFTFKTGLNPKAVSYVANLQSASAPVSQPSQTQPSQTQSTQSQSASLQSAPTTPASTPGTPTSSAAPAVSVPASVPASSGDNTAAP